LQADHNFHIVDEFNIVLVDTSHNFHRHYIVDDFRSVLVEKDDKFLLYDNQNKLNICRWKEITNSYIPFAFSNNNPSHGEHKHKKEV
jgi:hypothetical protein